MLLLRLAFLCRPDKQGYIADDKWALTYAINVTGPYLVADEAKKIWQAQGLEEQPGHYNQCQCRGCQAGIVCLRHQQSCGESSSA